MRKILAIGAALAVALTVTVGSAYATDDDNGGNGNDSGGLQVGANVNVNPGLKLNAGVNVATDPTTTPNPCHDGDTTNDAGCRGHFPGRGGIDGHRGGWYPGIPYGFPQLINNTYLPVNQFGLIGVGNVDVCTYSDWGTFDRFGSSRWGGRWGGARSHFGSNPAGTWLALRQAARCGSTVVVQQQLPTLIDGSYLNLGTYGLNGNVSVCQYPTFDSFSRVYGSRFGSRFGDFRGRFGRDLRGWNAGWNHLRLQASCAPSIVVAPSSQTIVQEAPTTTVEAAPQVTQSDPSDSDTRSSTPSTKGSVPSGSVASGGFDAAHLR